MSDLREVLRAAADPPAADEFDAVDLRRRVRRIRRRRSVSAAVVILTVVVAAGAVVVRQTVPDDRVEFTDRSVDGGARPTAPARWSPLPEAPLRTRWGSYAAWTGKEFVVWGGYAGAGTTDEYSAADGAAYDPVTRRWRGIARSPIPGMYDGPSVWTGEELWILGGTGDPNGRTATMAAAAYAPGTDTWRRLPDMPAPVAAAAWSADTHEAVIIGAAGSRRVWALSPHDTRWRELPATPVLPGHLEADASHALAAGDGWMHLVTADATHRLDLDDPVRWARLPNRPVMHERGDAPFVVWTDEGLLTVSRRATARYRPAGDGTGSWRSLPQSPDDLTAAASAVVGANGRVMAVDPSSLVAVTFDPGSSRWSRLSPPPLRSRLSAAVAGGEDSGASVLFVWAGSDTSNLPFADGALLRTPPGTPATP